MAAPTLAERIDTNHSLNKNLIKKWNTAIYDLGQPEHIKEIELEPNTCRRYIFDFYGLLIHLGIDHQYHYPHLLVNGYFSPLDYKGDVYTIKLIDLAILENYYKAFLK